MKRVLVIISVVLLSTGTLVAQRETNRSKLRFETEKWDFGTIEESDGVVSHLFKFVNTDSTAVVIERVATSCGCTTPTYSRRPIFGGGSGEVTISFDPTNRPGQFDKQINIWSGNGSNHNLITITGTVNPRPRTVEDDYPCLLGEGVRSNITHIAFGYIGQGRVKSMTIELMNTSQQRVRIDTVVTRSSGSAVIAMPLSIEPMEHATVTVTYDLKNRPHYGVMADQIRLQLNGNNASVPLSVAATGIDDFPRTTNRRKAPQFGMQPMFHNFGIAARGDRLEKSITITNYGSQPLVIRAVEPRPNTRTTLSAGTTIEAGGKIEFTVQLLAGDDDWGQLFGGVVIIASDPERPMRELRLSADLQQ